MNKEQFRHIAIVLQLLIVTAFSDVQAQQVERSELIGAYIYNFARLSSSDLQKEKSSYNIVLISEEPSLITELRALESSLKINDKEIKIFVADEIEEEYKQSCLIVIGEDKQKLYDEVFDKTKDYGTLLVSINNPNPRNILFNIYDTPDGNLLFEINKGNIYERKIGIKSEIELMGGTEIDVKELYLQAQSKLVESEKQLNTLKSVIDSTNSIIVRSEKEIENYKGEIEAYKEEMKQQKLLYEQQFERSKNLSDKLIEQKKEVSESKVYLGDIQDSLHALKLELNASNDEIYNNRQILSRQREAMNTKELTLQEKNKVISQQKNTVISFIIGFVVAFIILVLLYRSEKQKRQQNKLLAKQKQQLEKLNSTKDKLFRIISHDLLSPFSGMLGIANILNVSYGELNESERKEYIELINGEMENYLKLLNNLLEWSRLQTNDIQFSPSVWKLIDVIKTETDNVNMSASHKDISILFDDDMEYMVKADKNMVSIMLRNLLMNAVKYSDKGSIVKIKCHVSGNANPNLTTVSIIDEGIGFDKQNLELALDNGVMASKPGTIGEKGTGLGLFLCNEFAEKHGYKLKVETEVGIGSKISFSLDSVS
ncbi:YfiR/HmsC family protein [Carboxylicivirga sp. M1479]|uniref:YfiR/HmsC family protein n=1 Tax=Carboxylicivirga sp. M1479 TaxID=2594476 RepID=UPI0011780FBD|nr:YfiR/HmsC family protein [Carboxylicivirga sp. M1479]TRX70211.1 DUF4154 domain-containing protein [Carboxylicivirga sp. M1479]